jgi:predicted alpha/beta hydrolase
MFLVWLLFRSRAPRAMGIAEPADVDRPGATCPPLSAALASPVTLLGLGATRERRGLLRGIARAAARAGRLSADETVRVDYESDDGWEAPLWRLPPLSSATGEPVLVAHGLPFGTRTCHRLARALQRDGYDVYLLEHRGDRHAFPRAGAGPAGFDEIASCDVPAALARIRDASGFARPIFVGHALGGLLGYAHAAVGSAPELAAIATILSPVSFEIPQSRLRAARLVASLVPERWHVPARAIDNALAPFAQPEHLRPLARAVDERTGKAILLDGVEDVPGLLVKDVARWLERGSFTSRDDSLDYVQALAGRELPALVACAGERGLGGRRSVEPVLAALGPWAKPLVVDPSWGPLDPLLSPLADAAIFEPLLSWLRTVRRRCW